MSDEQRKNKRKKADASKDDSKRGGAQYHCDYCREDITNQIRVKCAECQDFDLCLVCFSNGVEVYPHRNTHKYRVMDHVTTPIFESSWGADEELLLLEGIEMYGLGNWSDVALHVDTKTKEMCEQHYNDVYLSSASAPLPDLTQTLPSKVEDNEDPSKRPKKMARKTKTDAKAKTYLPAKPKPKTGLGALVGYLPNRGDFETEYENDAELMLADMEFKNEDTEWEKELKLKVLGIYNSKLDARIERKTFILERGLLEQRKTQEPKRTKEEREVYNSMRVFARFHTKEEHEAFVQGLITEQRLRKRIEQLQNMRANGVRTLAEGEKFERERIQRDAQKKKPITPAMYESFKERGKKKSNESSSGSRKKDKGGDAPFDVYKCEGVECLSQTERTLCQELKLIPIHYTSIKKKLIQESLTRGFLEAGAARQLLTIDVHKTDRVLDFCVSAGWIHKEPSSSSTSSVPATLSSAD